MNYERYKKWKQENIEHYKNYQKQYYEKNKEKVLEQQAEYTKAYRKTKMGRAVSLVSNYKKHDRKHGRGEGDLTAEWVVTNILSQPCVHCGETDWTKIGCNRIDNTKPHTMDNVEPCCFHCNCVLSGKREHKRENGRFVK